MGRGFGACARVLGLGLGLVVVLLLPFVALGPAMVVDRAWDGAARVSAFPLALVVLDPLVWRCVRNSVAVALVVTVVSLVVGTGLGVLLGRRRFWGRWPLSVLAVAPLVVSPIWIAPGVVAWIGGASGWEWLGARSFLGQPGDEWARWFALVWVGVAGGGPLALLATRRSLLRVDPAWADAARVVGATRMRVWLDVSWPTVRPELARVGGTIFSWTLIEPAGPVVLDLRRTLVVELADAALRFDSPNRAATLAVIAGVVAIVGRSLFQRWGGPDWSGPAALSGATVVPRTGFRLGGMAVVILVVWSYLTLGPPIHLARRLVLATPGVRTFDGAAFRTILGEWFTPEVVVWIGNSAATASLAVGLDLILLACLAGGKRANFGWWIGPFAAVPPLTLAVGAMTVSSLLAAAAAFAADRPEVAGILEVIRVELSPGRSPNWLLVLVLAGGALPNLALWLGRPEKNITEAIDAALLAGASTRQARQISRGGQGSGGFGPIVLAWVWASTDLASAWLLSTLGERRTLAPAGLELIRHGADPLDPRLGAIFVVMLAVRVIGLGLLLRADRPPRGVGRV